MLFRQLSIGYRRLESQLLLDYEYQSSSKGDALLKKPAIPADEPVRLTCLLNTGLLDTPPDERFDRITRLAQKYFNVPITLVSLVDKERQWFKSNIGVAVKETPRDVSFCGHAILGSDIFLVPDAHIDERFSDNPLVVGPPNICFYAGLPLAGNDGSKIGTLCIVDTSPHELNSEDISVMRDLADIVESEIALIHEKQVTAKLRSKEERMRAVIDLIGDGEITLNPDGTVKTCGLIAAGVLNSTADQIIGKHVTALTSIDLG